jgi:uncharacterized protein (DUF1778 family)
MKTQKKYDPPRRLGRVSNSDWKTLKAAAKRSGQNFTQWALSLLLGAARKDK